jgi:PKD repeat protein
MKKTIIINILLLFLQNWLIACTIGVASGSVTASGRPILWKTRDISSYPVNYLQRNETEEYSFVYVRDQRDSLAWMGMNEKGFCLANSYVQREIEDRPIFNNGTLIYHLLGNCATISQMDAMLDTMDISSQVLSGNFGVIDSTGAAAIYEISWTQVQKYDAAESESGYVIRTNFSLISGGSEGIERYNRSHEIISELVSADELSAGSLMQQHFRDFSDDDSEEVPVPFYDRWFFDRPWGYIKTNDSICRGIAASGAVFEGVLPEEPAITTVMYALLGNPATSIFLPYFNVGELPHQATSLTGMQLTLYANQIKSLLFNFPDNSYYVDSFNLYEPDKIRVFDSLFPFDQEMYLAAEDFLSDWRQGNAFDDDAEIHSEYWVNQAMTLLDSLDERISNHLEADFEANIYSGGYPLTVVFSDQTTHYPTSLSWDFNNDGIIDAEDAYTPSWVYTQPGTYSVKLVVANAADTSQIIKEAFIQVNETSNSEIELYEQPVLLGNYPNPLQPSERNQITEILFYLPEATDNIRLDIFNYRGRKVASKVYGDTLSAGEHRWRWEGVDSSGNRLASGVYLYRLKVPGYRNLSNKLTIIH